VRDEFIRYFVGVVLGALIGALLVWRIAHDDADKTLADWESAVHAQKEAEVRRVNEINRRVVDGLDRDRTELRRRLAAGWKPTIPAAPGVPAGRVSNATCGTDETTPAGIPDTGGNEAVELAICEGERERLIQDGQETVLICNRVMGWIEDVARSKKRD
jgi:hypothetical protein